MTASTHARTTAGGARAREAAEPPARFRDLVGAEWLKLRSLRSVWIAHGATALLVIGLNAGTAYDRWSHWTARDTADLAGFVRDGIPLQIAFSANAALLMAVALGAIGALAVVGEYSSGTIRTTFTAVPARHSVMAAKAVVVAATATVSGALAACVSFAVTQAVLDRRGAGVSLGDPGALQVVAASALLAPVCALAGLALGAALRGTASAMVATVVCVLLLPLALTDGRHWSAVAGHALPYRAWLRLTDVPYAPEATPFPWTVSGAWTVYAGWACAACVLAVAAVRRRDH
ncbi:ABC transporter permease subunit [Streptomyces marincola]|uniref:ABC transporter permease subunit n=1 Tax=Streptomyces marincola TaxID=2878388 RepID=UPI001CF47557|nr:ABC transporter permease [Streptomyces marincola]UCM87951.1 ABC transporter permease subunit [Streptomyces marincola]